MTLYNMPASSGNVMPLQNNLSRTDQARQVHAPPRLLICTGSAWRGRLPRRSNNVSIYSRTTFHTCIEYLRLLFSEGA